MPRFLNTWTGEFEWHNDPADIPYAILSHVWRSPAEGGEQTYDDVRKIQDSARKTWRHLPRYIWDKDNPTASPIFSQPQLSAKIKGVCKVAREAGFRLVWNDACCIDKSSSAELSEAINSMYEWYRLSDVCYVYLADVRDGEDPWTGGSTVHNFHLSRWHKRGWTLQELIAPARVEFLTNTWRLLGTKMGLARILEEITTVPVGILTGRDAVDSLGVSQRMSWMASRETTRVEDQAYCMLGIFGVNMSPIYGEGHNAFFRLQEEIIRTTPDHSIFAWGRRCLIDSLDEVPSADTDMEVLPHSEFSRALFASTPKAFKDTSHRIHPISRAEFASRLRLKTAEDVPPLHCVFTPQGVQVRFLCLSLATAPQVFQLLWRAERPSYMGFGSKVSVVHADLLALLQCEDDDGALYALPLNQSLSVTDGRGTPIGVHIPRDKIGRSHKPIHIVRLSHEAVAQALAHAPLVPTDISILRHHSGPPLPKSWNASDIVSAFGRIELWSEDGAPDRIVFELAPRSVDTLRTIGWTASPLQVSRRSPEWCSEVQLETTLEHNPRQRRSDHPQRPPARIEIRLALTREEAPSQWAPDTKARFSVASTSSTGEIRCVDGRDGASAWRFNSLRCPRRTIVDAEFLLSSDADQADKLEVRILRIALDRPPQSFFASSNQNLWLYLELSDQYLSSPTKPPAEGPPSGRRTGDTLQSDAPGDARIEEDPSSRPIHGIAVDSSGVSRQVAGEVEQLEGDVWPGAERSPSPEYKLHNDPCVVQDSSSTRASQTSAFERSDVTRHGERPLHAVHDTPPPESVLPPDSSSSSATFARTVDNTSRDTAERCASPNSLPANASIREDDVPSSQMAPLDVDMASTVASLSAQNVALKSEVAYLSSQMAAVLERLEGLGWHMT